MDTWSMGDGEMKAGELGRLKVEGTRNVEDIPI
jgi:hypothetical protein